ncbi:hypothetical protein VP277E431_P0132 [Vibrio phage 277E43-1]|nr:hypothetical protein VP277E431_P0132 [Vibrio phage 277E43-1]
MLLDCTVGQPRHKCWNLLPEIKEVWEKNGRCGCENLSKFLMEDLNLKVSKTVCLKMIRLFREKD